MKKTIEPWLGLDGLSNSQDRELALILYGIGFSISFIAAAGLGISVLAGFVLAPKVAGLGLFLSLVLLGLIRMGYFRLTSALYPAMALVTFTVAAYLGDGLYDEMLFGLLAVIAMAGLLLRRRGTVIFTLLSLADIIFLAYAHYVGWIAKFADHFSLARPIMLFVMTGFCGALMYLAITNLATSITHLREKELSLDASNRELKEIRESLEAQVQERTTTANEALFEAEAARRVAETQTWLATGQAQLAEQMRGDLTLTVLANNILQYVCRYLGAQAGVLYLAEGENLHLTGSYAYVARPNSKNILRFGEGLIGQVARNQKTLILDQIPAEALLIASSLGESRPHQILIAPLEIDGRTIGVLELATLNEFTDLHQVFIDRCAESMAIAFRTSQARERFAVLLAESQRQTEELQAQEEELRAANEELHAQTENLRLAPDRKRNKHE